jgi:hypothetical protein
MELQSKKLAKSNLLTRTTVMLMGKSQVLLKLLEMVGAMGDGWVLQACQQ